MLITAHRMSTQRSRVQRNTPMLHAGELIYFAIGHPIKIVMITQNAADATIARAISMNGCSTAHTTFHISLTVSIVDDDLMMIR